MRLGDLQKESIKQLEFAIKLCQLDLDAARAGDWLNLKDELVDFLYERVHRKTGARNIDTSQPAPQFSKDLTESRDRATKKELTESIVREIQGNFRKILTDIAACRAGNPIAAINAKVTLWNAGPLLMTEPAGSSMLDRALLHLFKYCHLTISPEQIRLCDRPECRRLYISKRAVRKDANFHYCSNDCARRAATVAHRQREREKNRGKYEKRVRKKYPKATIKRNKTRTSTDN